MGSSESKPLPPALKDLKNLDPKEFDNYKKAYDSGGLSELKNKVKEDIDKWKSISVNIAVTGNTGVGKSSFINTFRGLKSDSDEAAAVGVDETTVIPTKYMHPKNKNIALWDLPGVGTQEYSKEKYLQKVSFDKYDYFIIITATRFTENDVWLANEVQRLGKDFYFARTKMSLDVLNDKHDKPGICKDETVSKVRQAMDKHVSNAGFKDTRVFLIDNHFPLDYDFSDITEAMLDKAPKLKQEAMTLTMTNLTRDLIYRKEEFLKSRIMKLAICSAVGGAIPLPGLGLVVDATIVFSEIRLYRDQFGLDEDSLQKNARSLDITFENFKEKSKLRSDLLGETSESIATVFTKLAISEIAESASALAIPFIGSIIGATLSYGNTVAILRAILDVFVKDALAVNKLLMEQLSAQSLS